MVNRDHYQLLGVSVKASNHEIRSAYRKRISVIHPDRFDAQLQPEQWRAANEMLIELNEAYRILHQPHTRALYDDAFLPKEPQKPVYTTVYYRFKDLPPVAKEKLLMLQKGRTQFFKLQSRTPIKSFRFKTGSPMLSWLSLVLAVLSLSLSLWFAIVAQWNPHLLFWGGASLGALAFIVAGYKLIGWYLSPVKDYVYLTPLYYIRTRPGQVIFRWLWSSDTLMVKPLTSRTGKHKGGQVILAFDDKPETLTVATEALAREVAYALSVWEKLIVDLNSGRDDALMDQLDAFPEISVQLGKRPAPDPNAQEAREKSHMGDGSERAGMVALEQNWYYRKGW